MFSWIFLFSPWGKFFPLLRFSFFSSLSANFTRNIQIFIYFFPRIFTRLNLPRTNFSRPQFDFFSRIFTENFPHARNLSLFNFSCVQISLIQQRTIDGPKATRWKRDDMKTHQNSSFNPRRRGRWMSQRSWYYSTIDQKTETDQQNKRMWMKISEEKEKSKQNFQEFLTRFSRSQLASLSLSRKSQH